MAGNTELAVVLKLVADQFASELHKSKGLLGDFSKAINDWRVQLAGIGGAMLAIAKSTATVGDEAVKNAQKTGTTVEGWQALAYSAKLSNVETQQLTSALTFYLKRAVEAARGNEEAQRTFAALGLSIVDAHGHLKSTDELLLELNDRFQAMPDGPQKTALAMEALGKAGKDLLPWLNSNIREAMAEAHRLGVVMSEQDAKAAEAFNDNLTRLLASVHGVVGALGTQVIPALNQLAMALTDLNGGSGKDFVAWISRGISGAAILGLTALDALVAKMRAVHAVAALFGSGVLPASAALFSKTNRAALAADLQASGDDLAQILAAREQQLRTLFMEGGADPKSDQPAHRTAAGSAVGGSGGTDLQRLKEDYRLYLQGLVSAGEEQLKRGRDGVQLYITGLLALAEDYRNAIKGTGDEMVAQFRAIQTVRQRELGAEVGLAQAKLQVAQSGLASSEELARRRREVLEAELDQELANTELNEKEKSAIVLRYTAQIAQERRRETGGFIEGWREGLHTYITDTASMWNLAVDMARETAQQMQQAFKTFFFDLFSGKVQDLKSMLRSLLDFTKQIIASVLATLATQAVLRGVLGLIGGAGTQYTSPIGPQPGTGTPLPSTATAHQGGQLVRRFAIGGPVFSNDDSVPALLTPGEWVVRRSGVDFLNRLNQGQMPGVSGPTNVSVQVINSGRTDQPRVDVQRNLHDMVVKIVFDDVRGNGPLRGLLQQGA